MVLFIYYFIYYLLLTVTYSLLVIDINWRSATYNMFSIYIN